MVISHLYKGNPPNLSPARSIFSFKAGLQHASASASRKMWPTQIFVLSYCPDCIPQVISERVK